MSITVAILSFTEQINFMKGKQITLKMGTGLYGVREICENEHIDRIQFCL
jgi:hypothetical protein